MTASPESAPRNAARWASALLLVAGLMAGCAGPSSPRPGGYYLDDGPPDTEGVDASNVPDAVPRPEPIRTAATRPYSAFGQRYVPMTRLETYRARGRASWYGRRYHGRPTASGERYDMMSMSAAHPTLPIPSYVRVTHLANGRQVIVRVNDRGPFHAGRLIDLSYAAAYKLDLVRSGGGDVEVELILPEAEAATVRAALHRLQLGAYRSERNARDALDDLKRELPWLAEKLVVRPDGEGLYRIYASAFATREEASRAVDRIERDIALRPLIQTETGP